MRAVLIWKICQCFQFYTLSLHCLGSAPNLFSIVGTVPPVTVLSAFQRKVRLSSQSSRENSDKRQAQRLQKAKAYFASFVLFRFLAGKKVFNAWNVLWSGSTKE